MAQGNFSTCLNLLLAHEGGFADRKGDPGGATWKGITLGMFRNWMAEKGKHACISLLGPGDLKALTDPQVACFYKDEFWGPCQCEGLPWGVDHVCFDTAVLSGQGTMVRMLQKEVGTPQDGKLGPLTLAALATKDAQTVIRGMQASRLAYFATLPHAKDNPGWATRAVAVTTEALAMVDKANFAANIEAVSHQPAKDTPDEKDEIQAQQDQSGQGPQEDGQRRL